MSTLYEETQRFRRELLTKDRAAASKMAAAYSRAYRDIATELDAVISRIRTLRDQGLDDTAIRAAIYQEGRLRVLLDKVRDQVARFASQADIIIGGSTEAARDLGRTAGGALVDIAIPEGLTVSPSVPTGTMTGSAVVSSEATPLATGAIERVVPATQLLRGLAPAAEDAVTKALVSGLAQGKNPRVIARMIRDALGGNLTRALTISRTETLRAYREAQREVYLEFPDLVTGQQWVCALDKRSCAACIALHGTIIKVDEPMPAHPNCRCTVAPLVDGGPRIRSGVQWFRSQPASLQREVLGPAKYEAYAARRITLPDLVDLKRSPVWGDSASVASLGTAAQNAAVRRMS